MIKINYSSLSEAFEDYEGMCKDGLKDLPDEVWDALEDRFEELDMEYNSLSELFDNLWINELYTDDAVNIDDEDEADILFVDEDGTAYVLA